MACRERLSIAGHGSKEDCLETWRTDLVDRVKTWRCFEDGAVRGLREFLSLSRMLTVATVGVPSVAFEALLRTMVNVSVDSFALSSIMTRLKLFAVSPGANVSVPAAAL